MKQSLLVVDDEQMIPESCVVEAVRAIRVHALGGMEPGDRPANPVGSAREGRRTQIRATAGVHVWKRRRTRGITAGIQKGSVAI